MKDLNKLRDKAYHCAVAHGWHEEDLSNEHFLCLVISELMEAVEADRKGSHADFEAFNKYCDRIDFKENFERQIKGTVEEELCDACIRLLDLAGLRGYDLDNFDYEGSDTEDYSNNNIFPFFKTKIPFHYFFLLIESIHNMPTTETRIPINIFRQRDSQRKKEKVSISCIIPTRINVPIST